LASGTLPSTITCRTLTLPTHSYSAATHSPIGKSITRHIKFAIGSFPTYEQSKSYTMELLASYKALLKNQDGDVIEQGEWLIVYDETFEVTFPSHEFFAKFKYLAKAFSDESYISICNETQEGWYDDTSLGKKGCFYAYKNENSKQNLIFTEPEKELLRGIDKQQLEKEIRSILNIAKSHASWEFKFSIEQQKILKDINKIKSISLSSSNFLNAINEKSELSKYSDSKIISVIRSYKNSIPSTNKFYKRFSTPINEFPDNELPEKFTWRDVDGVNYCPTVKNQDCGNCYAIASAAALESRLHIALDRPVAIFDTVELIKCNMFSEGCEGGFPYGVNKYLQDFGIHEAQCAQNRQADCAGIQESCKDYHLYK
jgi:cathepsin C